MHLLYCRLAGGCNPTSRSGGGGGGGGEGVLPGVCLCSLARTDCKNRLLPEISTLE